MADEKPLNLVIAIGKPKPGSPPPFRSRPGEKPEPQKSEPEPEVESTEETGGKTKESVHFRDQESTAYCANCKHFEDDEPQSCKASVPVDYDESDPVMSWCMMHELSGEEEPTESEEPETEEVPAA